MLGKWLLRLGLDESGEAGGGLEIALAAALWLVIRGALTKCGGRNVKENAVDWDVDVLDCLAIILRPVLLLIQS